MHDNRPHVTGTELHQDEQHNCESTITVLVVNGGLHKAGQVRWTPLEADLSPWAGRQVRVKLTSGVGPTDNCSGDGACWTGLRIESRKPTLVTTVHNHPVELPRCEGTGVPFEKDIQVKNRFRL